MHSFFPSSTLSSFNHSFTFLPLPSSPLHPALHSILYALSYHSFPPFLLSFTPPPFLHSIFLSPSLILPISFFHFPPFCPLHSHIYPIPSFSFTLLRFPFPRLPAVSLPPPSFNFLSLNPPPVSLFTSPFSLRLILSVLFLPSPCPLTYSTILLFHTFLTFISPYFPFLYPPHYPDTFPKLYTSCPPSQI